MAKLKTKACPAKLCEACGLPLRRKTFPSGVVEKPAVFSKRRFCNRKCAYDGGAYTGLDDRTTHGLARSTTYRAWEGMKQRCLNLRNRRYGDYGGRGITVCERWLVFENFLADMGERPAGMSLDRYPDNNGHYEPANCRWATPSQQQNNRRTNVRLTVGERTMNLIDWANIANLKPNTISTRLRRGWLPESAILPIGGVVHA